MSYLLDVNTLVAFGHTAHLHHRRALAWLQAIRSEAESLGTCSITELGFVRVSVQAGLQPDVRSACEAFSRMKKSSPVAFKFFTDSLGVDALPPYVKRPGDITDGHLLSLARAHGIQFATLDAGVPGAFLVPSLPADTAIEEAPAKYGKPPRLRHSKRVAALARS